LKVLSQNLEEWYQEEVEKFRNKIQDQLMRRRAYMVMYQRRHDVIARVRAYNKRPEVRARRREYARRHDVVARRNTPEQIARRNAKARFKYHTNPEVREKKREYARRPEQLLKRREHYMLPKIRERRKKYGKEYYQKNKQRIAVENKMKREKQNA